jgi:hypothetical protein
MLKQTLAIIVLTTSALALAQGDLPKRKSGLWQMTTTAETAKNAKGGVTSMQMCVDQKSDANWLSEGMSKDMCSKQDYKVEKNLITVNSVCKFGKSTATTRTLITGNYDSTYRIDSHATYDPPLSGRKDSKTVMDVKWLGPCKAGQKPGDMIMANGTTVNMNDMMKMKK